tara:strand:+ start:348 stop:650 length:303 start_codon:yes stop_codon:yes gene_type:complete
MVVEVDLELHLVAQVTLVDQEDQVVVEVKVALPLHQVQNQEDQEILLQQVPHKVMLVVMEYHTLQVVEVEQEELVLMEVQVVLHQELVVMEQQMILQEVA